MALTAPPEIGFGNSIHANRGHQSSFATQRFQCVLQREAVDHRRQHAHIVGRCFLDGVTPLLELRTAQNIAASDYDGQLTAHLLSSMDLSGDQHDLFHTDPLLAGTTKTLTGQFQDHAMIFWLQSCGVRHVRFSTAGYDDKRKAPARFRGFPSYLQRNYSRPSSQCTNREICIPLSLANLPTVIFCSFTNGCSSKTRSA